MFREIILPIFRSTRLCVTACGIMYPRCCRPLAVGLGYFLYTLQFDSVLYHLFFLNLTFRGPCIMIYSYNESQRDALFLKFICIFWIWHSEDHASWYILILKANEVHYFSYLFDKVLYMFWTCPLPIVRSISTLYTHNRYLTFQFCWHLLV